MTTTCYLCAARHAALSHPNHHSLLQCAPLRAPSSPPLTPMPMWKMPFSFISACRRSVFSYLKGSKGGNANCS